MSASDHLRPESVFGYEHNLLTADELLAVHRHIAACADCRAALAQRVDLNAIVDDARTALRPSSSRFYRYLAAAAAVLLAAASTLWLIRTHQPADPAIVQAALRAGRIELPPYLQDLSPAPQVLMGAPDSLPPQAFSPAGIVVAGLPIEFRWQAFEGWTDYQVRVYPLSGESVVTSPVLHATHWTCDRGLAPGEVYQWQVTASRIEVQGDVGQSQFLNLVRPPQLHPRFRLLDAVTAQRLRDLALRQPADHLLLGVEYAHAGLLEDARAQLTEAARRAPDRREIRTLLNNLPSRP